MAINQLSGNKMNGGINKTSIDANLKLMNVGFKDAKKGIEAAIVYLFN